MPIPRFFRHSTAILNRTIWHASVLERCMQISFKTFPHSRLAVIENYLENDTKKLNIADDEDNVNNRHSSFCVSQLTQRNRNILCLSFVQCLHTATLSCFRLFQLVYPIYSFHILYVPILSFVVFYLVSFL